MKSKSRRKATPGAPAFALVNNRNKIKVDTVCVDRQSVEFICEDAIKKGKGRVRRVRVLLENEVRKSK